MRQHIRLLTIISSLISIWLGVSYIEIDDLGVRSDVAGISAVASTVTTLLFLKHESIARFGFRAIYVFTLYLFHFGFTFAAWRGVAEIDRLSLIWVKNENTSAAYGLSLIGLGVTVISAVLSTRKREQIRTDKTVQQSYTVLGSVFFWSGGLLFLATAVLHRGIGFASSGYVEFLDGAPALPLSIAFLLSGFGAVLFFGFADKFEMNWTSVFGCFLMVVMLRIGFRGEVMMPAVAVLALRSIRGFAPNGRRTALLFLATLSMIPFLRNIRSSEASQFSFRLLDPTTGAAELGFTIRPVAVAFRWTQAEPRSGVTYFETISRGLSNFGLAEGDTIPLNAQVIQEAGPIGFSPIAEAYLNFGVVGVFLWSIVVMLALESLERFAEKSTHNLALAALVLAVLIYQVRNTFTQVPFQVAIALGIAGIGMLLARVSRAAPKLNTNSNTSVRSGYLKQIQGTAGPNA